MYRVVLRLERRQCHRPRVEWKQIVASLIAEGRHEYGGRNSAVMSNYNRFVLRRNSVSAAFLLSAAIQH